MSVVVTVIDTAGRVSRTIDSASVVVVDDVLVIGAGVTRIVFTTNEGGSVVEVVLVSVAVARFVAVLVIRICEWTADEVC